MSKVVTIHQPDFMPWLGLYNKIARADELVILDHVTNNPRDGFWCRRVMMMVGGKPAWVSLPLVKEEGKVAIPINQMEINPTQFRVLRKSFDSIRFNYTKAPYFKEVFPLVEEYFASEDNNLARRNSKFLIDTMHRLNINTEIVFSSDLDCNQKSTHLLVEILKKRNATEYLCGAGASGYQDDSLFGQSGIQLRYNNFQHPQYPQFNTTSFQKGLSIIDALMNVGFSETERLIKLSR